MKFTAAVALSLVGIVAVFGQARELEGVYQATETAALSPEEAQKRFQVPKGFEMRLFAAEPDIVNPVAMCWDERGRLWAVELYEYPLGAKPGEKPRDRVKILEDTDADGRADKVTVFKDGLNLATGILVGTAACMSAKRLISISSRTPMATTWPTRRRSCSRASAWKIVMSC